MKRFICVLTIFFAACSSDTNAPQAPGMPANPFLSKFSQVTVSFQNLPESWQEQVTTFRFDGGIDTSYTNSGTGGETGSMIFNFDTTTFRSSGDTLYASGINKVPYGTFSVALRTGPGSDSLAFLQLSYQMELGTSAGGWTASYSVLCRRVAYKSDSSNQITVPLSGPALRNGLASLSYDTSYNSMVYYRDYSYDIAYIDTVYNNSLLTIHFDK